MHFHHHNVLSKGENFQYNMFHGGIEVCFCGRVSCVHLDGWQGSIIYYGQGVSKRKKLRHCLSLEQIGEET